jgi:hypothetical protein
VATRSGKRAVKVKIEQIEEDAIAGEFDQLAEKALADHKAGRTKQI